MSIQPTDIAIFLVSFAACVYCFVLSKRLKALQNTKDGLGATITALSTSIAQMTSTTQDTRVRVESMATRLAHLISEAEATCRKLEETIASVDLAKASATDEVHTAQMDLYVMMRTVLDQSKERVAEMTGLMRQMRTMSDEAAASLAAPVTPASSILTRPRSA
jgi:predicted unusual protein kinase regulating ubiquinone biosynthesis (AarF/ABC1/UbiB family)